MGVVLRQYSLMAGHISYMRRRWPRTNETGRPLTEAAGSIQRTFVPRTEAQNVIFVPIWMLRGTLFCAVTLPKSAVRGSRFGSP
jgi:hypothetical protein